MQNCIYGVGKMTDQKFVLYLSANHTPLLSQRKISDAFQTPSPSRIQRRSHCLNMRQSGDLEYKQVTGLLQNRKSADITLSEVSIGQTACHAKHLNLGNSLQLLTAHSPYPCHSRRLDILLPESTNYFTEMMRLFQCCLHECV